MIRQAAWHTQGPARWDCFLLLFSSLIQSISDCLDGIIMPDVGVKPTHIYWCQNSIIRDIIENLWVNGSQEVRSILNIQARLNKFVPFFRANISNNKAWNPIKLGVKWKPWFSTFWGCPWIWDLDLNCPRYARKYDSNLDCKMSQNDSLLIQGV